VSGGADAAPASVPSVSVAPVVRERRHTMLFLNEIRAFSPVYLDTEIDMGAVAAHRAATRTAGHGYSVVSYVLWRAAGVLARHPAANAAIRGRARPRIARYRSVNGKLTLDRTLNGERVVLAVVLPELERASLDDVQRMVDHYRAGEPDHMPEFKRVRALQRLPWPARALAFRASVRPLARRPSMLGTFAVTSLGHRPVDGFHSVGGTTITLGVGRVLDRPVARDGQLAIAPTMRLSLAFDHRVIDGAQAADVLGEIKAALETPIEAEWVEAGAAATPADETADRAVAGHRLGR
jgi:pyruvate/2-oxoglutarate dehydrogenase complex dihydrolipoamide acyltransferase (E2) component